MRPPHEVLGVTAGATREQIRAAYKQKAFELHPDRAPGKAAEWAELQSAYKALTTEAEPDAEFVINLANKIEPVLHDVVNAGAKKAAEKLEKIGGDGWFGNCLRAVGKTVVSEGENWLRGSIAEGVKRATQTK